MPQSTSVPRCLVSFAVAASVCCFTASGAAQTVRVPESGGIPYPRITEEDVREMTDILRLDEAQVEIIRALLDSWAGAWDAEGEPIAELLAEIGTNISEQPDPGAAINRMREIQYQWHRRAGELERDFFDDAAALITDEQRRRWPIFERDRRRRLSLHSFRLFSGSDVDLAVLVKGLELPHVRLAAIEPSLNSWAEELDGILIELARIREWLNEHHPQRVILGESPFTWDDRRQRESRLRELQRALRDVTYRHAHRLRDAMETDDGERFLSAYFERAFPDIWGPTAADRYAQRLLTGADLSREQAEGVEGVMSQFGRRVSGVNQQLAEDRRRREAEATGQFLLGRGLELPRGVLMSTGWRVINGEFKQVVFHVREDWTPDEESPEALLRRQKAQLVRWAVESTLELLDADQRAAWPPPRADEMLTLQDRVERRLASLLAEKRREAGGDGREPHQVHQIVVTLDD